jgi:PAS domain S-box-containing protein
VSRSFDQLVLVENPDAVIATSTAGIVTGWSAGAERLFGYPADAAIGRPLTATILPAEREGEERELIGQALATPHASYESVRRRQDGGSLQSPSRCARCAIRAARSSR